MSISVVAIYVDSINWVEIEVDDDKLDLDPKAASYKIRGERVTFVFWT